MSTTPAHGQRQTQRESRETSQRDSERRRSSRASMEQAGCSKEDERKSPNSSQQPPPYLEVFCRTSGKFRRFAAGTIAGFAVHAINDKLEHGDTPALCIESVKEDEEPVTFGPNAILVNYGNGWKLQTIIKEGDSTKKLQQPPELYPEIAKTPNFQAFSGPKNRNQPGGGISLLYIWKILLAFGFMFLLGGMLTLLLGNLPAANLSGLSSE